jgi:adapter protein MecA 1/2
MLVEASEEFDVDIQGSVAVEIFSIQAQGMIMIITVDEETGDEDLLFDGLIEMQVRVEGCEDLLYEFESIEDIIGLSKRLSFLNIGGGSLYSLNNRYYLLINNLDTQNNEKAASLLSEYGNASILSPYVLAEYGNLIIDNKAVETILQFF